MGQEPSEIREEIEATRSRMGDTVEALGYKADVKSRARDKVTDKVDAVKSKVGGAGARVNEATPGGEDVKRAAGIVQQNPLGLTIGAVGVGFVVGMLLPSTRVEDEKLGPVADDVKSKVSETAQEAAERGKQVAQDAAQSAKETVQESGQEHAAGLRDSAQERAQSVQQPAGT